MKLWFHWPAEHFGIKYAACSPPSRFVEDTHHQRHVLISEETALHLSRSWADFWSRVSFQLKTLKSKLSENVHLAIRISMRNSHCNGRVGLQPERLHSNRGRERERIFPFKSRTQLEVTRVKSAWKMAFQFQWIKQVACHNSDEITVKTA